MKCPNCARLIICKVFPEGFKRVDIHCVCGYNWKGFSATAKQLETDDQHEFYGKWEPEEIVRVLRSIRNYCDNDLRFYKGKNLVTTWQKGAKLNKVLEFKTVTDLVKAI